MSEACTVEIAEPGCANLAGVLNFETTPKIYKEAGNLLDGQTAISAVNLSGVTAVDSTGLALLLEWQATRPVSSSSLRIINAPPSLMSLARLCDAIDLLNISGRNKEP